MITKFRISQLSHRARGVLSTVSGVFLLLGGEAGLAHQVSSVSLISHLDTEKREYMLDAAMEVVPSADRELNDQISPEDAARLFAEEYLEVRFDDKEVEPELSISIETASDENTPEELQRQQVLVKMSGKFPEGASEFLLYLDPSCPMAVVMVTIKDDRPSRRMQVILAGEYSRPVNIEPIVEGDPFTGDGSEPATAEGQDSPAAGDSQPEETVTGSGGGSSGGPASSISAGWNSFFAVSYLPLLFPFAFLLLTLDRDAAIGQMAALLIGQSLGVALAAWGILPVSTWAGPVAGILLAAVSFEAVLHRKCRMWRFPLALLAGLGAALLLSASVPFRESFPDSDISVSRLIGFLVGTELALLLAGVLAAGLLLFLSRFDWYRNAIVQPLAVLFGAYGIYLVVERFL